MNINPIYNPHPISFKWIKWLLRSCFVLLLMVFSINLHSQRIEVFGGINITHYYDSQENTVPYNWSRYSSKSNHFLGIGIEEVKIVGQNIRFTLDYHLTEGSAYSRVGTADMSSDFYVITDKSILSFGFYPYNQKIFNSFQISLGAVYSFLIRESYKGITTSFDANMNTGNSLDLQGRKFNSPHYFGLQGRLKYDFTLSKRVAIYPQHAFYMGLVEEFNDFPKDTKSIRHYFGIGANFKL